MVLKCKECGKEYEDDELENLRMHYIGSKSHSYSKKEFEDEYNADDSEETEENDDSGNKERGTSDISDEDPTQSDDSGEQKIDIDKYISGSGAEDEDENSTEEKGSSDSSIQKTGIAEAVNKGWGRILTMDLDPEDPETDKLRKQLVGLAEDTGLGNNMAWYYREEIKQDDHDDPKKAMMGSLVMAAIFSLSVRPDLGSKLGKKMKDRKKALNSEDEDGDE